MKDELGMRKRDMGVGALLAALAVQEGQRVLEVGCETAVSLVEVAARTAVTLAGTESSSTLLRLARRRLRLTGLAGQVGVYGADGRMLPFVSNSYHRVYTVHQLDHQQVGDAAAMLAQIFRVLRPEGVYVAQEAIAVGGVAVVPAKNQAAPWSLVEWLMLMRGVGFEVVAADVHVPYEIAFPPYPPHSPQMLTRSRWVSRVYGLRPDVMRQQLLAREQVKGGEADGRLLEERLFVLRKPSLSIHSGGR